MTTTPPKNFAKGTAVLPGQAPRLLDQVRDRIRVLHYSIRTEAVYLDWIKRYIRHFGKRHPRELGQGGSIGAKPYRPRRGCGGCVAYSPAAAQAARADGKRGKENEMASVNKVILVGNLGKDPEVRYMPSGDALATITVATSDSWKDKTSGEKKEATEWHRVVFFGKLAEIAGQYLKKGRQVYIEGALKTRKWQDKEGHDRYTTEIVASEMKMLGPREGGGSPDPDRGERSSGAASSEKSAPQPAASGIADFEDDIPF